MNPAETLDFETARQISRNGKRPVCTRVGGVTFRVGTRRDERYRKARIDVDLYAGEHDLKPSAVEDLRSQYWNYSKLAAPRKGCVSDAHQSFRPTGVSIEVRSRDAGKWFNKVLAMVTDEQNLIQIDTSPFPNDAFNRHVVD